MTILGADIGDSAGFALLWLLLTCGGIAALAILAAIVRIGLGLAEAQRIRKIAAWRARH